MTGQHPNPVLVAMLLAARDAMRPHFHRTWDVATCNEAVAHEVCRVLENHDALVGENLADELCTILNNL